MAAERPVTVRGVLLRVGQTVIFMVVSTLPMAVGVGLAALAPWFGHVRSSSPWMLLHFLWILLGVWFYETLADPVIRYFFGERWLRALGDLVDFLLHLALLTLMYRIFFHDLLGCAIAALLSIFLARPVVAWLQRTPPRAGPGRMTG